MAFFLLLIQRSKEKQKPFTNEGVTRGKIVTSTTNNAMGSKKFRNRIANFDNLQTIRSQIHRGFPTQTISTKVLISFWFNDKILRYHFLVHEGWVIMKFYVLQEPKSGNPNFIIEPTGDKYFNRVPTYTCLLLLQKSPPNELSKKISKSRLG